MKLTYNSNVELFRMKSFREGTAECMNFFPSCVKTSSDIMYIYDFEAWLKDPVAANSRQSSVVKSYSKHDDIVIRNLDVVFWK